VTKVAEVTEVAEGKVAACKLGSAALLIHASGSAADGILKTLSLKRVIDTAVGSLPRRELPTGLRDGDGFCALFI